MSNVSSQSSAAGFLSAKLHGLLWPLSRSPVTYLHRAPSQGRLSGTAFLDPRQCPAQWPLPPVRGLSFSADFACCSPPAAALHLSTPQRWAPLVLPYVLPRGDSTYAQGFKAHLEAMVPKSLSPPLTSSRKSTIQYPASQDI